MGDTQKQDLLSLTKVNQKPHSIWIKPTTWALSDWLPLVKLRFVWFWILAVGWMKSCGRPDVAPDHSFVTPVIAHMLPVASPVMQFCLASPNIQCCAMQNAWTCSSLLTNLRQPAPPTIWCFCRQSLTLIPILCIYCNGHLCSETRPSTSCWRFPGLSSFLPLPWPRECQDQRVGSWLTQILLLVQVRVAEPCCLFLLLLLIMHGDTMVLASVLQMMKWTWLFLLSWRRSHPS